MTAQQERQKYETEKISHVIILCFCKKMVVILNTFHQIIPWKYEKNKNSHKNIKCFVLNDFMFSKMLLNFKNKLNIFN